MNARELINALSAAHVAYARLAEFIADTKTQLKAELEPGDRLSARLEDGTDIGTVSLAKGRKGKPYVADRGEFVRWVEQYHPDEILTSVRASFETYVLQKVERDGDLPPGVEPGVRGAPYVTVTQSEEQKANVVEAWRDGRLSVPLDGPVTALTAGHSDE